ncbi:MAG: RNA polymerase factor sigma-54 [Lautropia sp.]
MGQSVSLQMHRNLSIAPALQRSLQLLQLNALEFEQEVNQALDSNPLLELDDSADPAATALDAPEAGSAAAIAAVENATADGEDFAADHAASASDEAKIGDSDSDTTTVEANGDEFNEPLSDWSTPSTKTGSGEGLTALDLTPAQDSLRDHLLTQLGSLRVTSLEYDLCLLVIDSLDPAGYLREDAEDLLELARQAAAAAGGRRPPIESDDIRIAISRVQSFDPPGVAARSMDECLLLQLRDLPPHSAGLATATAIVREHLPLLARNDFRELAARTGADEADLSAATRLIRSLDPKPGLAFGKDRVVFAVPEVIVKKVRGIWTAGLHPAATPRIRINPLYADIVGRNEGGQCSGLSAQLQEAKWLMRSIEQRANTIEKTAEAIVARQQAFFEHGDIGLQPLKLADIAADVGIHESTVSRVVNSKYLQCPAGLIPLRRFFTSHVETAAGNACSATAVKAMIRQLVDAEPAGEPLSDHRLTKLLMQRGIRIARRTVTKYRDAMGIEAADLRRHLHQPADDAAPRGKPAARVTRPTGPAPRSGLREPQPAAHA